MLGNTHLNITQSINSFINPMGLSLSNTKQIIAKTTTVALAAILLIGGTFNLPLASADMTPYQQCIYDCNHSNIPNSQLPQCFRDCFPLG